jgi:hypothetical protein
MRNYIKKSKEHLILLNSNALDTTGLNTCKPYSIITSNKSVRRRTEVPMAYFKELISIFCRRLKKIIKNVTQESCCPD